MAFGSSQKHRKIGRLAEWSIVLGIVTLMVLVLLPAVRNVRNPNGPSGEMVPSAPPEEARRVQNGSGLAIVLPENWEMKDFGSEWEQLYVYPRGMPGRRVKALISVEPLGDIASQDLSAFAATTFQGSQAYERMVVEREDTFDDPAWSRYTMYCQHDGRWWTVTYGLAQECEVLPSIVRQYINTIRWER